MTFATDGVPTIVTTVDIGNVASVAGGNTVVPTEGGGGAGASVTGAGGKIWPTGGAAGAGASVAGVTGGSIVVPCIGAALGAGAAPVAGGGFALFAIAA